MPYEISSVAMARQVRVLSLKNVERNRPVHCEKMGGIVCD